MSLSFCRSVLFFVFCIPFFADSVFEIYEVSDKPVSGGKTYYFENNETAPVHVKTPPILLKDSIQEASLIEVYANSDYKFLQIIFTPSADKKLKQHAKTHNDGSIALIIQGKAVDIRDNYLINRDNSTILNLDLRDRNEKILALLTQPEQFHPEESQISAPPLDLNNEANQQFKSALLFYREYLKSNKPEDLSKALLAVQSAIELEPENADYYYTQGAILASFKGSVESLSMAVSSLSKAVLINPEHISARFLLANTLMEQKKYFAARMQYRLIIEQSKNPSGLVLAPMALTYILQGTLEKGIDDFTKLHNEFPEKKYAGVVLAILLKNANQKDKAITLLKDICGHGTQSMGFFESLLYEVTNIKKEELFQYAETLLKKWPNEVK